MPDPVALRRRHCYLIEADEFPDALVRTLTPFAVQSAVLAGVVLTRDESGLSIRIDADGLDSRRAEVLLRRLRAMPVVRSVGLGWNGAVQAAA